jgi:exonuclease SbcC
MKLKRLALKNIRSYTDAEVAFPDGISLFSGDIGTGKSTLLYAIELALFGPAEGETRKKKDFYLRGDEKEGWVRLDVEVAGKEYSFHRELNRTGSGKCKVMVDGGFTEYAPSEMRRKVLDILGFNEPPGARASSVIYRYAVFTPQEEMKEILRMKEDDRIQTLRKAFRIEEYKTARENAETAARHFRSRSSVLDDVASELEGLRAILTERKAAAGKLSLELGRSENELGEVAPLLERLETEVRTLEQVRERRDSLRADRSRHEDRVGQLEREVAAAAEALTSMRQDEKRLEELKAHLAEDQKLSDRLEKLEQIIRENQELEVRLAKLRQMLENSERELARSEERRKALEKAQERVQDLAPEVEQLESVRRSLETYQSEEAKLHERIESIDSKVGELKEEKRAFRGLEKGKKCPKCGQELSAAHMEKVISDIDRKLEEWGREREKLSGKLESRVEKVGASRKRLEELEECRSELRNLEGEMKGLRQELAGARELAKSRDHLISELQRAEELRPEKDAGKEARQLRAQREQWENRRAEFSRLEGALAGKWLLEKQKGTSRLELEGAKETLRKAVEEQERLDGQYDEEAYRARKQLKEGTLKRLSFIQATIEGIRRHQEEAAAEIARTSSDIRAKEARLAQLARCREAAAWLAEFFGPALESIERHVLGHINAQFDELFRKWFGMLVEGTELDVTIDEDFTPVVNQAGYELDIWSLSGGEKTSVALAYRLALNHMVKEVSGVDQSNLLILDEPTDGFSTEQLSKVRDVLREVRAPQLIIVSHERELEGFADHVFRVVKENGASRVETVRG